MKKRRIFIAINLPDSVKKELFSLQQKIADLPVRLTKRSNLHITLVFIGYVDNEELLEICRLTKETAGEHSSFEVRINKVSLGPLKGRPRMVWAVGLKNIFIGDLRKKLEDSLFNSSKSGYRQLENKAFSPHITLGRINHSQWKKLPEKPEIDKKISITFPVDSIEIMESRLSRAGSDYIVLESVGLAG